MWLTCQLRVLPIQNGEDEYLLEHGYRTTSVVKPIGHPSGGVSQALPESAGPPNTNFPRISTVQQLRSQCPHQES